MATISRLSVSLTANTKGLSRGLKRARASVKKFTKQIFSLKGAIVGAIGVGSLGALATSSINAFAKQEQAVAGLNASIKSMKRTTKGLSGELQKLASQLQKEGIIGDEEILMGASFLTTYGKITDELLPRTIRVMVDLAAKTGSTTSAAKLLGKASMGLVGSLSIAGISLSDATKKSKDFEAILGEIEDQVGGMNKALGDTATGGITQFKNAMGDIQEKMGEVLAVAFSPWLRHISGLLGDVSFDAKKMGQQLSDSMLNAAKAMAPLADALAGIQLVWKSLKLAAAGFGLFVADVIKGISADIRKLPGFLGGNLISDNAMDEINRFWQSQLNTVQRLKKEIADFTTDLGDRAPSTKIKIEIDKFALDVEVAAMKKRLGLVEGGTFAKQSAAPAGVLSRLEVSTTPNPQIDTTNDLLARMVSVMGKNPQGAVAQ